MLLIQLLRVGPAVPTVAADVLAVEQVLHATEHVESPGAHREGSVDAHVNALYWYFVVGTWVGVYVLVYLVPRWS